MFAHPLQHLCLEKRVAAAVCQLIAAHKIVEFTVADFLLGRSLDNAARTYIIKEIQQLCRVGDAFVVQVECDHRRPRLLCKSDIIEIGRFDDGEFRFGIGKPPQLMFGKSISLLFDALQIAFCAFTIVVEKLVLRFALAQSHSLHIGHEPLYQIVGRDAVQLPFCAVVVHLRNAHESQMIHRLGTSVGIVGRGLVGAFRIDAHRVERAIVIGVCQIVQLVHRIVVFRRASGEKYRNQQGDQTFFHDRKDRIKFLKIQIFLTN